MSSQTLTSRYIAQCIVNSYIQHAFMWTSGLLTTINCLNYLQWDRKNEELCFTHLTKVFNCQCSWSSTQNVLCLADCSQRFLGETLSVPNLVLFPNSRPGRQGPAAAVAPLHPAFGCCSLLGFCSWCCSWAGARWLFGAGLGHPPHAWDPGPMHCCRDHYEL